MAQQIIVMFCLSYFTGLIWYTFCSYADVKGEDTFLQTFEFEIKYTTNFKRVTMLAYFAFTTLTTVGLGDFHPR